LQNEGSGILDDLGFQHLAAVSSVTKETMFPLPGSMLAVDMAYRRKQRIAIELDGPSHFLQEVESGKVLEVKNGASGMESGQYSIFRLGQSQKQRSKTFICINSNNEKRSGFKCSSNS
jgi:hypothetical protein